MAMIYGGGHVNPLVRRFAWVDASNVLLGLKEKLDLKHLRADNPPRAAVELVRLLVNWSLQHDQLNRYYWVGPCSGGAEGITKLGDWLRNPIRIIDGVGIPGENVRFEPILKNKPTSEGEKGKGVDSALVLSMLTNAWNGNYQVGLLASGDTDFSDLVTELKRHGPIINGTAFDSRSKDPNYRTLFDGWTPLDSYFDPQKNHGDGWRLLIKTLKETDGKP
jgi:hypothetical protein